MACFCVVEKNSLVIFLLYWFLENITCVPTSTFYISPIGMLYELFMSTCDKFARMYGTSVWKQETRAPFY